MYSYIQFKGYFYSNTYEPPVRSKFIAGSLEAVALGLNPKYIVLPFPIHFS